jgi:hypothetical protein
VAHPSSDRTLFFLNETIYLRHDIISKKSSGDGSVNLK